MKPKDLIGETFGVLTVVARADNCKHGGSRWECECECGTVKTVHSTNLGKNTNSCGCRRSDHRITHGETRRGSYPRLYGILNGMKQRCYNPKRETYKWYGGKGVRVCDQWKDSYVNFKRWALANGYMDNLSIDRIDSDGDYSPDNCQWITLSDNVKRCFA